MECVKRDAVKKFGSRVKPGAETNMSVFIYSGSSLVQFLKKFALKE
jgi:hypothetical protein